MAPEIREQNVFSSIRADRWSCSKVLLCFFEKSGTEDEDLESFAKQLMDDNPLHQPSLVNCDTNEMDEGGNKESKAQVRDDVRTDGGLENPRRVDVGSKVDEGERPAIVKHW